MRSLLRLIGRFRKDKRGNIAVIFAIACIPIISAVGCAVDYSLATRMKAKMQSAADGAAVASISDRSLGYVAAAAMTGNGSVTAGVTDANNIFDGNINNVTGYANLSRNSTVTKTGVKLTSVVTFSADVPVTFMKVVGYQTLTVSGSSSASASLPPYLDFYLSFAFFQVLQVSIKRNEINTLKTFIYHIVNCITPCAAYTDNFDFCPVETICY